MTDRLTVPSELVWHGDAPLITFSSIDMADLDSPFLDEALARGRISHFTPLDALGLDDGDLRLAGGVHHMTRCGSTLVRRQFDALPGIIALSEPFMVQHLLEGPAATPRRIRQLVAAWRDALAPVAERLVIKWPSLAAQHAAALADALPEVPMIFLHRDPVAVLASIDAASLGGLAHVQPHHLFDDAQTISRAIPADPLEAWARLIARTCRLAAGTANVRTVDYANLPGASWTHIAPYFGLTLTTADETAMRAVATFHSKDRRPFTGDPERRDGGDRLRRLAETILAPALDELVQRTPALFSQRESVHGSSGKSG